MSSGLILLGYALIAGTVGTAWLRHARWPEGSPRLGILAWQSLASSVLLAVCGFALSLAMSLAHAVDDLTAVFGLCAQTVGHTYNSLTETAAALVGLAAFSLLVARSLWLRVRGSLQRRREQADRVSILDMVGDHVRVPGAVVITHTEPYAFCISGKRRRVVLTSAAVASLNDQEVEAVLAHEWAHLGQGHHRTLASCNALFAVVAPLFSAFRMALGRVQLYVELCADDVAREQVGARPLRAALVALACRPTPPGSLAASSADVAARVRRLSRSRPRLAPLRLLAVSSAIVGAVAAPLATVAVPSLALGWEGLCSVF